MGKLNLKCIDDCVDMCLAAWNLGWHECHAGNISYRLTAEERAEALAQAAMPGEWQPLPEALPDLAGECFLMSAAGSSFRTLDRTPDRELGLLEMNARGDAWLRLWGFEGGRPTSELPAHLANHAIKRRWGGEDYRVIYHAHPTNLIALSFVLPLTDRTFTRELWEMEPECAMIFPKGIGVLPWVTPGSEQSAFETGEKMKRFDVVLWAYHGTFCAAETFEKALGLMHTVEKAAEMLSKVLAMGGKRQKPAAKNLRDLEEPFGLELPEMFLLEDPAGAQSQ